LIHAILFAFLYIQLNAAIYLFVNISANIF